MRTELCLFSSETCVYLEWGLPHSGGLATLEWMNSHPYFQWQHSFHKITHINVYTPIHKLLRAPPCDPHSIALHTPHEEDRGICPSGPSTVGTFHAMPLTYSSPSWPQPSARAGKSLSKCVSDEDMNESPFPKDMRHVEVASLRYLRSPNLNCWPWLPVSGQIGWGVLFDFSWWPPVLFFMSQRTPDLAVTWSSRKEQSQPQLQLVLYMQPSSGQSIANGSAD